jgi:hypothetical protein
MNSGKKELTANQYYILREKEQSAFQNEFHDNHKREITFAWLQIAFIFQKLNLIRQQVGLAFSMF